MRILYLHGNIVPPHPDPRRNRLTWLSEKVEGDVLQQVWFRRPDDVERQLGPGSYPICTIGRFRYHLLLESRTRLVGKVLLAWFFISRGLRIHRERAFDCIVTYAHTLTGLCGVVLKFITGAKLIVEIVSEPAKAYTSERPRPGIRARIMKSYSDMCACISLRACDRAHLLAPSLVASYKALRHVPASVFFEGVPVSQVPRHVDTSERYILLVGAPWYLKGVDVLIRAFRRLADDFPDVKLRILGYYPDRDRLDPLVRGAPQIEILKPRANPEVLDIISKSTVFALPSRSEGLGLVILEAMAAGVPVVASDTGGIPTLVRDGENGFVVPVGNVYALEDRLRLLLSDSELRDRMGARGYALAHTEFSEQSYVDHFVQMLEATVRDGGLQLPDASTRCRPHAAVGRAR